MSDVSHARSGTRLETFGKPCCGHCTCSPTLRSLPLSTSYCLPLQWPCECSTLIRVETGVAHNRSIQHSSREQTRCFFPPRISNSQHRVWPGSNPRVSRVRWRQPCPRCLRAVVKRCCRCPASGMRWWLQRLARILPPWLPGQHVGVLHASHRRCIRQGDAC